MSMKKFLSNLSRGSAGLLFQASFTFQPLTKGTESLGTAFSGFGQSMTLPQFFNAVFTMSISVGAILAVLQLARAGWLYMSSDAFGTKSRAKEIIRDAIIGLLLLLGIYIILFQINPNILNLDVLRCIGNTNASGQCQQQSTQETGVVNLIG